MRLVFLGAPGTGKGTQANLLAEKLLIPRISTGDMLREAVADQTALGKRAQRFIDKGELVPDNVMIQLILVRLGAPDCVSGFILDGFPRTEAQARALDAHLDSFGSNIDLVILMVVPEEEIVARLSSRRVCRSCNYTYNLLTDPPPANGKCGYCGGELVQRSDDSESTVRSRLRVYGQQTAPLRAYFEKQGKLRVISGDQPVSDVHESILEVVKRAA